MNGILMKRISRRNVRGITDEMDMEVIEYKSKRGKVKPNPYNMTSVSDTNKVIRWGCTSRINADITYNKPEAIRKASDKLRARKILEKNDVPIPKTYSLSELSNGYELPLIGRPKKHHGGKNFYYCETVIDVSKAVADGCEYFQEFYPKTKEYRVHACHGKVIICSEKFVDDEDTLVWNLTRNKNGEFKALRWSQIPPHIAKLGIKAVQALGLDYGAVDIIAEPKVDKPHNAVVLEVNTAPKLGEYGASRYAEYFDWLLYKNEKREHKEPSYDYWRNFVWSREALKGGE